MPLTEEEKGDVRRHLGYPVAGLPVLSPSGGTLMAGSIGYRFTQAYGQLEYRLNSLQPHEEARLMGRYVAALMVGGTPNVGDTVAVTISGGGLANPVTITAIATQGMAQPMLPVPTSVVLPAGIQSVPQGNSQVTVTTNAQLPYVVIGLVPSWSTTAFLVSASNGSFVVGFGTPAPSGATLQWELSALNISQPIVPSTDNGIRLGLCAALQALTLTNATLTAARITAQAPYGTGPLPSTSVPMATVSWIAQSAFSISVVSTGSTAASVVASGSALYPQVQYKQQGVVNTVYGYVPILNFIEGQQGGSVVNMDTAKADVWQARINEWEQKTSLYFWWAKHLADFLGPGLWTCSPRFNEINARGSGTRVRI